MLKSFEEYSSSKMVSPAVAALQTLLDLIKKSNGE